MKFNKYLNDIVTKIDELVKESKSITDVKAFLEWIDQFPKSGKAPRGKKKEFEDIKFLQHQADMVRQFGLDKSEMMMSNVQNTLSRHDIEDLENIFLSIKKIENIQHGNITFINESSMAESTFIQRSNQIYKFLSTLKGYHKKAIQKPLKIVFKATKKFKSKAKYKELEDEIWVKQGAKADNELYGHLLYIIIHELGHRYQKLFGLPKQWRPKYTTKYSQTSSAFSTDAEPFAELFALSHWPNKYKEYQDQIKWYKGIM